MNKKLVAAAIAAAMAAPAAFADVTVYGVAHMSVDSVDADTAAVTIDGATGNVTTANAASYDGQAIASRASRLGFKGSEDLGNGLKAVWKMEFALNMDAPSNGLGGNARSNYLGLAGSFGTIMLAGRENTPMKMSTGKMDFFGDTLADYNSTIGFEDNRLNNAINYISPKFSGLQFAAMLGAGESTATSGPTNGSDGLADAYSVALTYNNAGIMGALAYENLEDLGKTGKKWRAGLGYKMNAFKVAGVYEDRSDVAGIDGVDSKAWQVSAAYSMGNNTVKAMYGSIEYKAAGAKADGDAWAIGVDHNMSKRTKVYALYTDSEAGLHGESNSKLYGATAVSYDSTADTYTVTGGEGSGFSLGMIHKF